MVDGRLGARALLDILPCKSSNRGQIQQKSNPRQLSDELMALGGGGRMVESSKLKICGQDKLLVSR
jgi:hypothetical protein